MPGFYKIAVAMGIGKIKDRELKVKIPPNNQGNRLCLNLSDIHLTDRTVVFQNLHDTWNAFYDAIYQSRIRYDINELLVVLVLVLDDDIIDITRSRN